MFLFNQIISNVLEHRGRSRILIWGGGGVGVQKVMCQHAHYKRGTELTFGRGPGPA